MILKQYNTLKQMKRGCKLWSLADMDRYLHQFNVYQGENEIDQDPDMSKYFGLGDKRSI